MTAGHGTQEKGRIGVMNRRPRLMVIAGFAVASIAFAWLDANVAAIAFVAEHLERLQATGSCAECDLAGADLRGDDYGGVNADQANLKVAFLYRADLRGADLAGANLPEAMLLGADLAGANLRRTNLQGADLRGTNLIGADLSGADLSGATLFQYQIDLACGDDSTRLPEGRAIPRC